MRSDKMPEEIERLYTINFTRVYKVGPKTQRAARLVKHIREFVGQHMKAEEAKVWIDGKVNESMWGRGILKPPRNIRIKATKFDDGVVEVTLPEVEKKEGKKAKAKAAEEVEKKAKKEKQAEKPKTADSRATEGRSESSAVERQHEEAPPAAPAPAASAPPAKPEAKAEPKEKPAEPKP